MSPTKVIVFGPTGGVGSAAALKAHKLGAKVYLGMRDTDKPIPGLTPEAEQAGNFERIHADLSQPSTLRDAVAKTGAKHAFIYLVYGSPDHMRSSIEALQSAGIEFIVFLSSVTVSDPRAATPADFIAFLHAQVEIALEETMGKGNYATVRPGYFNTNALKWKPALQAGGAAFKIPFPDAEFDWISPEDIGKVSGQLLVHKLRAADGSAGENVVYLAGPEMISQRDAAAVLGRQLGRELEVLPLEEDQLIPWMMEGFGVPEPGAKVLVEGWRKRNEKTDNQYAGDVYDRAVANIQRYSGEKPATWAEWTRENYGLFQD